MFTGIIETLGRIEGVTRSGASARLTVMPAVAVTGLATGESIAVNGVCLTVEEASRPERLIFYTSTETLRRSTLGEMKPGAAVNLERAMRADGRLGGHLVLGHVDGLGAVRRLDRQGEEWLLEVSFPKELAPYLAEKGSVAVDGISLTVAALTGETFGVAVIPHTVQSTNLSKMVAGAAVNLEVDVMARYVVRALEVYGSSKGTAGVTMDTLRRAGF